MNILVKIYIHIREKIVTSTPVAIKKPYRVKFVYSKVPFTIKVNNTTKIKYNNIAKI